MSQKLRESVKKYYQNKCCFCGISDWQGKQLTLQVDHIDGNRKNNDMSNLRLLCPNCHSQTDTYTFKKTQSTFMNKLKNYLKNYSQTQIQEFFLKNNYYEICELTGTSLRSIRKYLKENPKIIPKHICFREKNNMFTYDELYDLLVVKKIPVSVLAKAHNVSHALIRKKARQLNIVIPAFYSKK